MLLFNKKLLFQHIARYEFPSGQQLKDIQKILSGWQKALKNSNLDRTKETGVQGQFLSKFFETILGYNTQTSGNDLWYLNQEPKTEVDAQEADGSLGFFTKNSEKTLVVIELKDAKTSLDKKQPGKIGKLTPVEQAFQYLNKFDGCKWVIVSNFREIRIYSKLRGQGFYEKFDIINLTEEQEFKRFYYILNKHNLIDEGQKSVIDYLVEDTTTQEENITKKFYEHYKEIRIKILNHLFEHNPDLNRLLLVEKTQKLLDRLIFTLVCEDSSTLLPAHLVKNTYDGAFQSFALSNSDQRVWTEFKGLFHAIDEGNEKVVPKINKYNGGLFKIDEILDNLTIKDDIWTEIIKLTQYDFESDLNVNVLGHIFEQSISDLEEIRESISLITEDNDKLLTENGNSIVLEQDHVSLVEKKGKRKKMGIFYTPEYITKFIVENTIGKYLEENPNKLESIKILDPACGSGAFLNQAHSFLLNEYKIKTEQKQLEKQQKGKEITLWDTNTVENDKSILLNNLFGVDLNPESVDITKLALWLKTAKATEPLQNLDNNIKCGNSLIDDPVVAGNRAFNWNSEFKEITDQGGFDVIVGNPPYVYAREKISLNEKEYFNSKYISAEYQLNTFVLFIEKSINLLKDDGFLGFVIPNSLLKIGSISKLRKYILDNTSICTIVSLSGYSFENVNVETVILVVQKNSKNSQVEVKEIESDIDIYSQKSLSINSLRWKINPNYEFDIYSSDTDLELIDKIQKKSKNLDSLFNVKAGLQAYEKGKGNPIQNEENVKNRPYDFKTKVDGNTHKYLEGKNISRYLVQGFSYWLKYGDNLAAPRTFDIFCRPRILVREITNNQPYCFHASFVEETFLNNRSIVNVLHSKNDKKKLLNLLAIINSKLISWYFVKTNPKANRSMFPKLILRDLANFPIVLPKDEKGLNKIEERVTKILKLTEKLFTEKNRLNEILVSKFKLKNTTNFTNFYQLGWNEFIAELEKQKIKLDLNEQDKLNKWFNKVKKSLLDLEQEINGIDKQINQIVYSLYELTKEEIAIVENDN